MSHTHGEVLYLHSTFPFSERVTILVVMFLPIFVHELWIIACKSSEDLLMAWQYLLMKWIHIYSQLNPFARIITILVIFLSLFVIQPYPSFGTNLRTCGWPNNTLSWSEFVFAPNYIYPLATVMILVLVVVKFLSFFVNQP